MIDVFRRLPLKAKIGVAILAFYILIAIIGPWIAPYDPNATTTQALPGAPNFLHLFGTSATGGDVFSQVLIGTRATVTLGLLTAVIATILSVLVGMAAGFLGVFAMRASHWSPRLSRVARVAAAGRDPWISPAHW